MVHPGCGWRRLPPDMDSNCECTEAVNGALTKSGPPTGGLGMEVTPPHRKKSLCYEMLHRAKAKLMKMDMRFATWKVRSPIQGSFTNNSCKRNNKVKVGLTESTGGQIGQGWD
jgi:hypothetical protein